MARRIFGYLLSSHQSGYMYLSQKFYLTLLLRDEICTRRNIYVTCYFESSLSSVPIYCVKWRTLFKFPWSLCHYLDIFNITIIVWTKLNWRCRWSGWPGGLARAPWRGARCLRWRSTSAAPPARGACPGAEPELPRGTSRWLRTSLWSLPQYALLPLT